MSGVKSPESHTSGPTDQSKSSDGSTGKGLTPNKTLLVAIVAFSKILAFAIIWGVFGGPQSFQNADLRKPWYPTTFPTHFNSLYILTNWDSNWFMGIARYGYTGFHFPLSFADSPFYPFLIHLLSTLTNDVVLSAVAISFAFGVGWIVALDKMAELYMPKDEALNVSLLAAFFPLTFFLTTIAYTEPIFLFLATAAWLFYVKRRYAVSSLLSGACAVTRGYGIIVAALICCDLARKHNPKQAIAFSVPSLLSYGGFLAYGYVLTGDPLISFHALISRSSGGYVASVGWFLWQLAQARVVELSLGTMAFLWYGGLVLILCLKLYRLDIRLAVFSFATFILMLSAPTASLPRYLLGSIFPLWLAVRFPRRLVMLTIPFFFAFSLLLLYQFNSQLPNLFP
jgi:hypothetical protein